MLNPPRPCALLRPIPGALVLGLAALSIGCERRDTRAPLPATCQDIKAANPRAVDGEFTLYFSGKADMRWTAWCRNMAGTPSEYLVLARTGPDTNFAQYTAGGPSPGTTVRTHYTRLRIDPVSLRVMTGDQTFATSTGALQHGDTRVTAMPYGVAMTCDSGQAPANIDLRGTPFAVAPGQFAAGGWHATGQATYREANQVVHLEGGGFCGWDAPAGSYNPFNQEGTPLLLLYAGAR
jgi:hypothetical protein